MSSGGAQLGTEQGVCPENRQQTSKGLPKEGQGWGLPRVTAGGGSILTSGLLPSSRP